MVADFPKMAETILPKILILASGSIVEAAFEHRLNQSFRLILGRQLTLWCVPEGEALAFLGDPMYLPFQFMGCIEGDRPS